MGHKVTITKVDGIERFLTTHGHTLECDECGEQYNGGNDEDKGGPLMPQGYRGMSPTQILDHGIRLGWTGLEKYQDPSKVKGVAPPDRCPVCAAMKGAPYWPAIIHEPIAHAILFYRADGPLMQSHTVVLPLTRTKIHISSLDWPERDRYNEPPAVLKLKIVANEKNPDGWIFNTTIHWPGQKGKPQFKAKSPIIRLWSWGDGKVYAKEVSR